MKITRIVPDPIPIKYVLELSEAELDTLIYATKGGERIRTSDETDLHNQLRLWR